MYDTLLAIHLSLPTAKSTPSFILALVVSTALFIGVMAVLHQLSPQAKKWMTIICTFIAGLYFIFEYFWPVHAMKDGGVGNFVTPTVEPVSDFVNYIFIWTIGLGIISLVLVHGRRLLRLQPGWHNSLALFIAMISIAVYGLISNLGTTGSKAMQVTYDSLFNGLLVNLDAAMFALLAFYIASAAYRAFRVRTVEAGLLMFAALLVMLGLVNFGVMLTSGIPTDSPLAFFRIERLSSWLMLWINMPVQRAVTIGVAIGSLAMAMRIWLSLERGAFFSQEK